MNKIVLLIVVCAAVQSIWAQNLIFNEAMSSNQINIRDEDNDTPDWFELVNTGSTAIDLSTYSVCDKNDTASVWTFPPFTVGANQYLMVYASNKDRGPIYWKTIITEGDNWKYVVPDASTSTSWMNPTFDDSGWSTGASGFGYADNDDNTVLEGIVSVFIRKTFTISSVSEIADAMLHMDYDDAFVAYLNGTEIARANITSVGPPAYNAFATGSAHEAGLAEGFEIEDISSLLVDGDNVLAVQIHNAGTNSSDLSGIPYFSLGSTVNNGGTIESFMEIPQVKFHTDFKISSDGETLYLFKNKVLVDSVQIPFLPTNVSYGRDEAGDQSWRYFSDATPAAINNTTAYDTLSSKVYFSKLGGIYSGSGMYVSLSSDKVSDKIYYTTDATEPTTSSNLYTRQISVQGTTLLRAKVINNGEMPGMTSTQSYLYGVSHDLPIISLVTEPDNFFDDSTGIYVTGAVRWPSSGKDCDGGQNFWQDWERPVHVSMINTDGTLAFEQNAGVKIFGGCSRTFAQKSLSLRFRKSYGKDGLKYKVFDNLDIDKFYSLSLRNSGNDWSNTMMKDGLLGKLFPKQLDKQAFQASVVYLNGEYWGIHNLRERIDEDYVNSHYDVDESSVNMMEFHVNFKLNEVEGDGQTYLDMLDYIERNGTSADTSYDYIKSVIDVENFALYQTCNIMVKNTDWPGNNVKFWSSDEYDSKWRWMVYDLDFGFNDIGHNTLLFALDDNGPNWPNPPASTYLLRKLNENQDFQHLFINCFADMMNTKWLSGYIDPIIDEMKGGISSEIEAHKTRWGQNNYGGWSSTVDGFKSYAANRPTYIDGFIRDFYGISGTYLLSLNVSDNAQGSIKLNTIQPEVYPWSGGYFNDIPVTLIAKPNKGYRFVRWEGVITSSQDTIILTRSTETSVTAVFEEDDNYEDIIVINEINHVNMTGETSDDWVELYNAGSIDVDLSNWIIKDEQDDHEFVISEGTSIKAGEYLVVCKDTLAYRTYYGKDGEGVGNIDFGFGNTSDCVRLYNYQEVLVDSVGYNTIVDGGIRYTYQRFVEEGAEVWYVISGYGTPNAVNEKGTIISVGEKKMIQSFEVEAYPNPFAGNITIKFKNEKSGRVSINLLSLNGRLLHSISDQEYSAGHHLINWTHGSELDPGVYVLHVKSNNQVKFIKVVKH